MFKNPWEQVTIVNGVSQVSEAEKGFPHFVVIGELLYQVTDVRAGVVN